MWLLASVAEERHRTLMFVPTRDESRRREFRLMRVRRAMQAPRRRGRVLYLHPGAEGNEHGTTTLVVYE
jgi:hypothetical protein